MFSKKNKESTSKKIEPQSSYENYTLHPSLDRNITLFKEIFQDDDTLVIRHFENQQQAAIKSCILFIEGMVDIELVNENVIQPFVQNTMLKSSNHSIHSLQDQVMISNQVEKTSNVDKLIRAILRGDTVFFLDGSSEALIMSTKGWQSRPITEPEGEKIIRGPREGFTEPIMVNLSMIRRRLETPNLKFKFTTVGVQSHTKVCICYIEGIANHKILDELKKRLDDIDIDGVMASGYIAELIKDSPYSPFKTVGSTERPDIVAAKLLEGRIAIIADGTPVALTLPHLFVEYFQANEDYYINFYFSSISRLLRILSFIVSVCLPGIYVALMTFHQEMIPTPLLLSISAARQGVPFPTIVEVFGLLIVFEILREAGTRMPSNIGQALSIVGALVLGQASVEAKIVSAPVVIIVAFTGITGLMIPRLKGVTILLRDIFLLLSAFLGLYGFIFGIIGFLLHLCELRSFGIPYTLYLTSLDPKDIKDTVIRAPWWYMKYRPKLIVANNRVRQAMEGKKP